MTAVDPLRRLSPVVRLAPAKLNLTLAVVGRRDDGYHTLHSVFVPLTLADRLSLAPLGGDRDTLHVSGLDAGPPARQPRVPRAGGRPGGGRRRLGRRTRSGTGPRRPARQADPGRGRAGRWILGRRGDPRRRDRGVGRRAGRAHPSRGRRPSRFGCAVLPGRRSGARRGARRTGRAAPRPPRSTGRRARDAARSPSRRPTSSPPSMPSGPTATAPSGCRRRTSPRSCAPG